MESTCAIEPKLLNRKDGVFENKVWDWRPGYVGGVEQNDPGIFVANSSRQAEWSISSFNFPPLDVLDSPAITRVLVSQDAVQYMSQEALVRDEAGFGKYSVGFIPADDVDAYCWVSFKVDYSDNRSHASDTDP